MTISEPILTLLTVDNKLVFTLELLISLKSAKLVIFKRVCHFLKQMVIGEKDCFRNITNQNVYSNEVCRGKQEETFDSAYRNCVKDISPINTVKLTGNLGS